MTKFIARNITIARRCRPARRTMGDCVANEVGSRGVAIPAVMTSGAHDGSGDDAASPCRRVRVPSMIQAARNVDSEEREAIIAVVGGLVASALKPGE